MAGIRIPHQDVPYLPAPFIREMIQWRLNREKTRKEMRSDAPAPISGFLTVSVPMAMDLPWEARCREELRMWLYGTAILEIRSMGLR